MKTGFYYFVATLVLVLVLTGCSRETLRGEVIYETDYTMEMSYDLFRGTRMRTVTLEAGMVVTVDLVTYGGTLAISFTAESGNRPFFGNGLTTPFSFEITEDGEHTIRIDGDSHRGSYKITWE